MKEEVVIKKTLLDYLPTWVSLWLAMAFIGFGLILLPLIIDSLPKWLRRVLKKYERKTLAK